MTGACRSGDTGGARRGGRCGAGQVYYYVKDALDYLLEYSYEGARWMERIPNVTSYTGMPLRFRGVSDAHVGAPLRRLYLKALRARARYAAAMSPR